MGWIISEFRTSSPHLLRFKVPLDHFSPLSSDGEIEMQYLADISHFSPSGNACKLFVILGGESSMNTTRIGYPFVSDRLAKKFGAALVQTEHRFYGDSWPQGPQTTLRNRYLSVEQVLEDYASLISYFRHSGGCPNGNKKIVGVFGGSYPGALAALMRLRYPHLVDFAHASSAPLAFYGGQIQNKFDYYKIVTEAVRATNPDCPDHVRESLLELSQLDIRDLETIGVCPDGKPTIQEIIQLVRNFFANSNMAHYPPHVSGPAERLCQDIGKAGASADDKMRSIIKHLAREQDNHDTGACIFNVQKERPSGSKSVICSDHSGCGSALNGASWDYQACTELVHAIASNGESDMFPPLEFSGQLQEQYCLDRFGVSPNYSKLNDLWGIEDLDSLTSRILFANGGRDGWTAGAITNSSNSILISDGAHHSEMGPDRDDDTDAMRNARNQIESMIDSFIKDVLSGATEVDVNVTYQTV